MSKVLSAECVSARYELRGIFPPGSTCQTILRHVSRSGMTRAISPVADGEDVTWLVVRAVPGFTFDRRYGGVKISGCGMDMGFHLVYVLSRTLYPEGFDCTGEDSYRDAGNGSRIGPCPSNDHSNGDRIYDASPHHHADGGYAIQQAWL